MPRRLIAGICSLCACLITDIIDTDHKSNFGNNGSGSSDVVGLAQLSSFAAGGCRAVLPAQS